MRQQKQTVALVEPVKPAGKRRALSAPAPYEVTVAPPGLEWADKASGKRGYYVEALRPLLAASELAEALGKQGLGDRKITEVRAALLGLASARLAGVEHGLACSGGQQGSGAACERRGS